MNAKFVKQMIFDSAFRRMQLIVSGRFREILPGLYWRMFPYILETSAPIPRYTRLHVILRTTDAVMNVNQNRQLEKIGLRTKTDVIRMGAGSVAEAVRRFQKTYGDDKVKVTVVADRLSDRGVALYDEVFAGSRFELVKSLPGNANTFRAQIDLALQNDDETLVAVYEDDYLTDPSTFMVAFELFNTTPRLAGFTPHNHPNVLRLAELTRLYALQSRLYKMVKTTTCTFIAGVDLVRRRRKLFYRYDGFEGLSINRVWAKEICLAPCGWSLAEHLHRSDLSPVQKLIK